MLYSAKYRGKKIIENMQEEAQPEIPIEFKVDLTDQHPTQHKYAFWFHRRGNKSSVNYDNYGVKFLIHQ